MYYVDPSPTASAITSCWKCKYAGCNLCCLRLGILNSPVSSAFMRWRWKLVHDAEKYVRHCRHAHNINESKHLIKKLRSWQSQYLRYVAGNHRKCGKALNQVWHVMDDVQNKIWPVDVFVLLWVEWLLAGGLNRWRCWKCTPYSK